MSTYLKCKVTDKVTGFEDCGTFLHSILMDIIYQVSVTLFSGLYDDLRCHSDIPHAKVKHRKIYYSYNSEQ